MSNMLSYCWLSLFWITSLILILHWTEPYHKSRFVPVLSLHGFVQTGSIITTKDTAKSNVKEPSPRWTEKNDLEVHYTLYRCKTLSTMMKYSLNYNYLFTNFCTLKIIIILCPNMHIYQVLLFPDTWVFGFETAYALFLPWEYKQECHGCDQTSPTGWGQHAKHGKYCKRDGEVSCMKSAEVPCTKGIGYYGKLNLELNLEVKGLNKIKCTWKPSFLVSSFFFLTKSN